MDKRNAFLTTLILLLACPGAAFAADTTVPEIPSHLPNPFNKPVKEKVVIADHLSELEETLYGEINKEKSDEVRMSALERTIFGTSYSKNSTIARVVAMEKLVDHLTTARTLFDEKKYTESKAELDVLGKMLTRDWKSLVKAEVLYRLGMCEFELSNYRAVKADRTKKADGTLMRSSKDNLTKAAEYYKSLGQPETAQKITAFVDTFKKDAETYFLY